MHRSIRRRGFNLIEAAIVLAVVGLVIGGIWAAASAVTNHMKWVNTQKGWVYYTNIITRNYNSRITDNLGTGSRDIESFLINFPAPEGWTITGGHPIDPYGYMLYASIQPTNATFTIGYPWQTVSNPLCSYLPGLIAQVGRSYKIAWSNTTCASPVGYFNLPTN